MYLFDLQVSCLHWLAAAVGPPSQLLNDFAAQISVQCRPHADAWERSYKALQAEAVIVTTVAT